MYVRFHLFHAFNSLVVSCNSKLLYKTKGFHCLFLIKLNIIMATVAPSRARRVSKGPRLALLQFDVDETSLIVATSDLMKLPANNGKELVVNGTIACNVDGVVHEANLLYLTDDREEAHAFEKRFWEKNKTNQVLTCLNVIVFITYYYKYYVSCFIFIFIYKYSLRQK